MLTACTYRHHASIPAGMPATRRRSVLRSIPVTSQTAALVIPARFIAPLMIVLYSSIGHLLSYRYPICGQSAIYLPVDDAWGMLSIGGVYEQR